MNSATTGGRKEQTWELAPSKCSWELEQCNQSSTLGGEIQQQQEHQKEETAARAPDIVFGYFAPIDLNECRDQDTVCLNDAPSSSSDTLHCHHRSESTISRWPRPNTHIKRTRGGQGRTSTCDFGTSAPEQRVRRRRWWR